jgi:hypothetical protein
MGNVFNLSFGEQLCQNFSKDNKQLTEQDLKLSQERTLRTYTKNSLTVQCLDKYYIKFLSIQDTNSLNFCNYYLYTDFIICLNGTIHENIKSIRKTESILYMRWNNNVGNKITFNSFLNINWYPCKNFISLKGLDGTYYREHYFTNERELVDGIFRKFLSDFIDKKMILGQFIDIHCLNYDIIEFIFYLLVRTKYIF